MCWRMRLKSMCIWWILRRRGSVSESPLMSPRAGGGGRVVE
jgi:hypothetical protein